VLVEIREGRTANFIIGVAADSSNGIFGDISFTQRNFDILGWPGPGREFWKGRAFKGAGQRLRFSAQPGTTLSRFYVDWFEPALFDKPYALGVNLYYYTRGLESYDMTRTGLVTSLGHRFKNRWYGELAAKVEWSELRDPDFDAPIEVLDDEGNHLMPSIKGTLVRDRTDSRWLPSDGDRFEFSYEQFYGDYPFGRLDASYRIYRTLYTNAAEEKHILAGKLSAGQIVGDAPVFESYYAGGLRSLRGFEYRGVSPRGTNTDDPIGGDWRLLLSTEYSYPIIGDTLRGVLFLDTGTVEDDLSLSKYRVSAGFGFRWTVPLFGPVPISLDFGFPLAKEDEDDTQVFSFTLGWTF
jgi:outer membrane protein assembly factor BamA